MKSGKMKKMMKNTIRLIMKNFKRIARKPTKLGPKFSKKGTTKTILILKTTKMNLKLWKLNLRDKNPKFKS
jgi:hypothetical protein